MAPEQSTLQRLVAQVPRFEAFPSFGELDESSRRLAAEFPGRVRRLSVGFTRGGRELFGLIIGDGPRTALCVGLPHANEPIGGVVCAYLAQRWAEEPQFDEATGVRLVLVPALDRDGLELNAGWLGGPYTPLNYALNSYRGPSHRQPEWGFPIEYRGYRFSDPPPESQSLMRLIREVRPDLLVSFHNGTVSPLWFYVSHPMPGLAEALREFPGENGYRLNSGQVAEEPWNRKVSEGVYLGLSLRRGIDYALGRGLDPAMLFHHGASSFEWTAGVNPSSLGLAIEAPIFRDPRAGDARPTGTSRAEVREGHARRWDHVADIVKRVRHEVRVAGRPRPGPFLESIEFAAPFFETRRVLDADGSPPPDGAASVGEAFAAEIGSRLYLMRLCGIAFRYVQEQLPASPVRRRLESEVQQEIDQLDAVVGRELAGRWVPIREQVQLQVAGVTAALRATSSREP